MKRETLEEAAERLIFKTIGGNYGIMSSDENDQVDGYYNTYEEAYLTLKLKWQHQGYSEEDMIEFDKEKSVVITTMGQKLVRELQSTTQEETIEKIAENESEYLADWEDKDMYKRGFVDGANWKAQRISLMKIELNHAKTLLESCEKALEDRDKKAQRMYSEDDVDELVNNLIDKFLNYNGSSVDNEKLKWFYQQLKKK